MNKTVDARHFVSNIHGRVRKSVRPDALPKRVQKKCSAIAVDGYKCIGSRFHVMIDRHR